MKRLSLLLILCQTASADLFVFGVRAGVPLTDAFNTASSGRLSYSSLTRRYTIGPTAELHLPFGLGLELDALYKRLNYSAVSADPSQLTSETTANSWEFPFLAKYRAPGLLTRPFLAAGYSFRKLSDLKQFIANRGPLGEPAELRDRSARGIVLGGGLELHLPGVCLSPEIRYTRWGSESFRDAAGLLRSSRNQADFLLGITF